MPKIGWGILSLASLAACLISAVLHFLGRISTQDFRVIFLLASVGWFVFATLWARPRKV
jgi:hypothetical protein